MQFAQRSGGAHNPGRIEKAKDSRQALLRLGAFLQPFIPQMLLVFLFVVIYTLLDLAGPYLMGRAIDRYITNKDIAGLVKISTLMLAVFILNSGFQIASNWVMARVSQQALKNLRQKLFTTLQRLSLTFFDHNQAGELMSRLTNDIEAVNQAVSQNVTSILASVLGMLGIVIAMFLLNFWLALASLIVLPIMFWFTNFVARYTRRGFRELQKQLGLITATMEETLSGQRVVMAFQRNESAIDNFREKNQAVYKAGVYANNYAMLLMPLTNQLGNLFVIVLAGLGGYLALKGITTVGTIATFISYGRQFISPLRQLANIYNSIQAALAGSERVFEILDTQPEPKDNSDAHPLEHVRGQVIFENVKFGYAADDPILKNMNLVAEPGETIALVGPTGAGKTTIINLLTRFYDIQAGSIRIDGMDIRDIKRDDLRRELGLVLQDTYLFSATVMENIRLGRLGASDAACIQAAKMADADYFIRQLPQGYHSDLAERASNLSQGQRQLLAISRAILADPGILILDEATSSVDTRTEARIQKSLLRLMAGRTSFVIAHRLSTIREASKVIVIDHGEIVEQGSHAELLASKGFYYNLYMSQFKGHAI
ncbi:MAG TPA: multidrug ABC transporter ATP-binding protein [Anaerolineae bacterium]|nr:multidrug ABC transporter ATP-binding protein [Anaerolineae bacterium]